MSSFENGWALTLIVFVPVVGAAAILAIPKAKEEAQKWTALLFAGVSFILSVIVAFQFDYGAAADVQFGTRSDLTWIGASDGIQFAKIMQELVTQLKALGPNTAKLKMVI